MVLKWIFSAILNFPNCSCYSPFKGINPSKAQFWKYKKNYGSLSPRAYKQDLMVFNRCCLDSLQRYVHRPYNTALGVAWGLQGRPGRVPAQVWLWGRGQAYYDIRNCSGVGRFKNRAEAGDLKFSTYNAGGIDERGIIHWTESLSLHENHTTVILNKA
jgi:hypothetical protein